eukprot:gene4198-biopygen13018
MIRLESPTSYPARGGGGDIPRGGEADMQVRTADTLDGGHPRRALPRTGAAPPPEAGSPLCPYRDAWVRCGGLHPFVHFLATLAARPVTSQAESPLPIDLAAASHSSLSWGRA